MDGEEARSGSDEEGADRKFYLEWNYHKNTTQKVLKNLYIIGISQHLPVSPVFSLNSLTHGVQNVIINLEYSM